MPQVRGRANELGCAGMEVRGLVAPRVRLRAAIAPITCSCHLLCFGCLTSPIRHVQPTDPRSVWLRRVHQRVGIEESDSH